MLEEVKHRSTTLYKRLKDIISNVNRKFYVFANEHHKFVSPEVVFYFETFVVKTESWWRWIFSRDTYIEREPGESANDRNDRAIRVAAKWYDDHLLESQKHVGAKKRVRIVLLTDDNANKEEATNIGLYAASSMWFSITLMTCVNVVFLIQSNFFLVEDYVHCLHNSNGLEDKLCRKELTSVENTKEIYPCHLTPVQIHDGVKIGKLHQGSFLASRENFLEGHVNVEGFEKPVSFFYIRILGWIFPSIIDSISHVVDSSPRS